LLLYLLDLGGVGFLSTDEPRYASIGRAMARSGDWITPRLDGSGWFEKPPLLYWMVAAGHEIGLPEEWAARLPVALFSVAFLLLMYRYVAQEYTPKTGIAAVTILATSAGWLAYSFGALTDLPMAAMLGSAMLFAFFEKRSWGGWASGAALGLAILAKAFVPVVLFAPLFLLAKGRRVPIFCATVAVAAPWHIVCYARNGFVFWDEYFWKQQFGRFFTTERQHVQKWWFYVPVLLGGLFPWTPLAALAFLKSTYEDRRMRWLGAWILYGFVFFSASQNKLAGYVLPLMPAVALLLAVGIDKVREEHGIFPWLLAASAGMLIALPTVVHALPDAMLAGMSKTHVHPALATPFALVAGVVLWLARRNKPTLAILTTGMAVVCGIAYLKGAVFPELDRRVSARGFWREHGRDACIDNVGRAWEYGLNYYAGRPLHACVEGETPRIAVEAGRLVVK